MRASKVIGPLAGTCLFLLCFRRALPSEAIIAARDALQLHLPLKTFLAEELRAGRIPTWFPYEGVGFSFVGSAVGGLLHPSTLLYLFLPPSQALKWSVVLSYPVAAVGSGLLSRKLGASRAGGWLAALTYGGCGYLFSETDNLTFLFSATLIPWTLLGAERLAEQPRAVRAATLGAVLAVVLAGGDVQGFLLQAVLASCVVVARLGANRRSALGVGTTAFFSASFSLPILIPVWAAFRESGRTSGIGADVAFAWAFHPVRLLEWVVGTVVPADQAEAAAPFEGGFHGALWAGSEFVGVVALAAVVAALIGRRPNARGYAGLALLALLLAMGNSGALYPVLYKVLPLWRAFRYPEKLMPFALSPLAVVAGLGATELLQPGGRWARRLGLASFVMFPVAISVRAEGVDRVLAVLGPSRNLALATAVTPLLQARLILAALALAGLAACVARRWEWGGVVIQVAQFGLCVGGWSGEGQTTWFTERSPFAEPISAGLSQVPGRICWDVEGYQFDGSGRWTEPNALRGDRMTLANDYQAFERIGSINSYSPGTNGHLEAACSRNPPCASPCSRRLSARFDVVSDEVAARLAQQGGVLELMQTTNPSAKLLADPLARPWVIPLLGRAIPLEADAEHRFATDGSTVLTEALLVGANQDQPAAEGNLVARRPRPDRIAVDADLSRGGLVVISEQASAGWRATLDGVPLAIEVVDLALIGLELPAGQHRVELEFVPPGWPWAWGAWLLALAAWIVLAVTAQRSRVTLGTR